MMKNLVIILLLSLKWGYASSQSISDNEFALSELKKIENKMNNAFSFLDEKQIILSAIYKNGLIANINIKKNEKDGFATHEFSATYLMNGTSKFIKNKDSKKEFIVWLSSEIKSYELLINTYIENGMTNIKNDIEKNDRKNAVNFKLLGVTSDFESELIINKIDIGTDASIINVSYFINL